MRTMSDETDRVRARNRRAVDQARARAESGAADADDMELSRTELRAAKAREQAATVARDGLPPPDLTRAERRSRAQRAALEAGAPLTVAGGHAERFQRDHTPRRVREAAEAAAAEAEAATVALDATEPAKPAA